MTPSIVVVGVGNPWRGDDGVGWAVVAALEECRAGDRVEAPPHPVELVQADGEAGRLIEWWGGRSLAVVVDAVVSGAPVGTIVELGHTELESGDGSLGSHGLGVEDAAALAKALGRLPQHLVVIGVEGRAFDHGSTLSPEVADAVPRVIERINTLIAELPTCA